MKLLVLNHQEVEEMLTMSECIAVMEEALSALARGEMHQPLRSMMRPDGAAGILGLMPAYRRGSAPLFGLKEICVFPGNPARGLDSHLGAVLLHSGETGELLAVMNASAITAIRTAAVSAVATKLLAREDAHTLALIGAGVQAETHLRSLSLVRDFREVRIFSRTRGKAEAVAQAFTTAQMHVVVTDDIEAAVRGADVVTTVTSSREPVIRLEWLAAGTHINAVGSSIASARELDSATMAAGLLFVDRRESTRNESGDFLMARNEGAIGDDAIRGEIGELLTGQAEGRRSSNEITIFKSLGLATEDLAAAAFLYEKALAAGRGTLIDFHP
ncbi:MAG: ornithine cyclodeaminase family protein [Thermoanaerobaculia bacterium]